MLERVQIRPQLEGGVDPLSASHTSILSITQVGLLWDLYVGLSRTERQQLEATTMFGGCARSGPASCAEYSL
jgi:hypothetical protein